MTHTLANTKWIRFSHFKDKKKAQTSQATCSNYWISSEGRVGLGWGRKTVGYLWGGKLNMLSSTVYLQPEGTGNLTKILSFARNLTPDPEASIMYRALSWTLCFYRGDTHKTQYELCIWMSVPSTYAHTLLSPEDTPTLRHVPLIPTLRRDLLRSMQWLLGIGVVEARHPGVFMLWRDFMKGNKLFLKAPPMLKTLLWLSTALGQPPHSQFKCHCIPIGLFHPPLSLFPSPSEWIPFRNPNAHGLPIPWLYRLYNSAQMISFCLCSWFQ